MIHFKYKDLQCFWAIFINLATGRIFITHWY